MKTILIMLFALGFYCADAQRTDNIVAKSATSPQFKK